MRLSIISGQLFSRINPEGNRLGTHILYICVIFKRKWVVTLQISFVQHSNNKSGGAPLESLPHVIRFYVVT